MAWIKASKMALIVADEIPFSMTAETNAERYDKHHRKQ